MAVKNMAASVLARLKSQAKAEKISFQMVLQLFAQEEFLRKLKHRGREQNPDAFEEIRNFENNAFLNTQWKAFEPAQAVGLEFSEAMVRLETFLKPVYESILENREWDAAWICADKTWVKEEE